MSQRADRKTTLKKIIYSIELDVSVELFINCQFNRERFHWSSTVSANSNSIGLHTQTVRDTFFRRVLSNEFEYEAKTRKISHSYNVPWMQMLNLIFIFRKFSNTDLDSGETTVAHNTWKDAIKVCDKHPRYMY